MKTHILTDRGSIAYFLPDLEMKGEKYKRCADLILDGEGVLKNRYDEGRFICFFEMTGELHTWSYNELRSIIGK